MEAHHGDSTLSPDDGDASRPSAVELARKRAERFGIPLVPVTEPKAPVKKDHEMDTEESTEKAVSAAMEPYRDLIASALPEGSILETDDFLGDNRNARLVERLIEHAGEEKVKEVVLEVANKISVDFENDRSKIQSPPRLASFRFGRSLKAALPKSETTPDRVQKTIEKKPAEKKDAWKAKWTDAEWAEWSKNKDQAGGAKKKDWSDWKKGGNDWKSSGKDWKSGGSDWKSGGSDWKSNDKWGNKGYSNDYKKKPVDYDSFESDVEEFIYSNKLDKRSSQALREESKGMVGYVMDQGFNLNRFSNPSKEVMMRMKAYTNNKRGYNYPAKSSARSRSRSYSARRDAPSRSRSIVKGGKQYVQAGAAREMDRSVSRSRSRGRSDSRDRYHRGSRSESM